MPLESFRASSDVNTFAGDFGAFCEVYAGITNEVELIALRPLSRTQQLLLQAQDLGLFIPCIHGPVISNLSHAVRGISFQERPRLLAAWMMMPGYEDVLRAFSGMLECLVHAPVLRDRHNVGLLLDKYRNGFVQHFWVENHTSAGALGEAVGAAAYLSEKGMDRVGLMVDIAHFLREFHGSGGDWARAVTPSSAGECLGVLSHQLDYFKRETNGTAKVGIHFPIGTDPTDSIPQWLLLGDWLQELGAIGEAHELAVMVLENQQTSMFGKFFHQVEDVSIARGRAEMAINALLRSWPNFCLSNFEK